MAKYSIEPEDEIEMALFLNARSAFTSLFEMDQQLRSIIKYQCDNYTTEAINMAEKIRGILFEIMDNNNINLGMLK